MEPTWAIGILSLAVNLVVLVVNAKSRADMAELKALLYKELKEYVRRDEVQSPIFGVRRREHSR
jgi:hypothetical protein